MSNQVISISKDQNLPISHEQKFGVIKNTLYPGSSDSEVNMILDYCTARKIDPLLKPIHLVPMSVKTDRKDGYGKAIYEWKSVVMPGIGLYRIDAARTGQYMGISEPEFGEDVTEMIGKSTVTYPKWCKISVKRLMPNGVVGEFTVKEYWKENYATKSKDDISPNAMWSKRTYGQLAKCAEAQALRKAFPESIGNHPTFEEMDGKLFDNNDLKAIKPKTVLEPSQIINAIPIQQPQEEVVDNLKIEEEYDELGLMLSQCESMDELQKCFVLIKSRNFKSRPDLFKKLIDAKDAKKQELMVTEFNQEYDSTTGEINNDATL